MPMKTKFSLKQILWLIFFGGVIFAGIQVGDIISDHYATIAHGILGIVTIYLWNRIAFAPHKIVQLPIETLFDFPKNLQNIIPVFFQSLIYYWALELAIGAVWVIFFQN